MTDRIILRREISDKLVSLRDESPGKSDTFYQFANYLADQIGREDDVVPLGLVLTYALLTSDLRTGLDGRGRPLSQRLMDPSFSEYALSSSNFLKVMKLVSPSDFYLEVEQRIIEFNL